MYRLSNPLPYCEDIQINEAEAIRVLGYSDMVSDLG
jgi:hypothetical protein